MVADSMCVQSDSHFRKFVTWVLVLSPVLQTYGWGKYDFAFIVTTMAGLLAIIRKECKYKYLPKFLLGYLLYWLVIHAISSTSLFSVISLGTLKTIIVFSTFFSIISLPLLNKYYSIVVKICIVFFILQLIVKYAIGINIPGVFSFLPMANNYDAADYFEVAATAERVSSFFSEPAIFAQYLVPYLCLTLFDNRLQRKDKVVKSSILIAIFILLQSGNALFGVVVCLLLFLLFRMKGGIYKKIQTLLIVFVFLLGGSYILKTEMGEKLLSRKDEISINSIDNLGYASSGFERVFRGYYVYGGYSTFCKIVGNDNPEYKRTAAMSSIISQFFSEEKQDYLYCNTFQMVLLNTGIIGLLIMFFVFRGIWQTTNYCGKDLLLTFFAFSLFSASYFSEIMCLYILLPALMGRCQSHYE